VLESQELQQGDVDAGCSLPLLVARAVLSSLCSPRVLLAKGLWVLELMLELFLTVTCAGVLLALKGMQGGQAASINCDGAA
jgi:hypothetical protein